MMSVTASDKRRQQENRVEILARVEENELVYESLGGGIVRSAQGIQIVTDRLGKANPDSVLVIPGGRGTRRKQADR